MSGIGRGRGWLNINKNLNTKPGIPSQVENSINYDFNSTIITAAPKINPKHANIISKISLFNENDDGILMNQKLKHIIEEFQGDCPTAKDVEEAFESIHETCLIDAEFASKATAMVSTPSFNSVNVHGIKIRNLFIAQFQKDFENSKQMQISNPRGFRNIVKMLGDFFNKARLVDGQPLKFLSSPMLKYLEMLLESSQDIDLKLFTVQLYMNGNGIKEELPSKLSELLVQVRTMIAHNDRITSMGRLWLMMALDISNNRYNFLPADLNQFYLTQLGDEPMSHIKKLNTELSIQTSYQYMSLDSIQSTVNVLQPVSSATDNWESPSSTTSTLDAEKTNEIPTKYPTKARNFKNNDVGFNNIGTWEQPKNEKSSWEHLKNDKSTWEQPKNDKSSWEHPKNDKSTWDQPKKDKSSWEHPKNDKSTWDQPKNDKSSWEQPKNDKSSWEHPKNDKSTWEQPKNEKTCWEHPKNDKSTWDQPKSEKTPRPILGAGVRLKHTENNLNKTSEDPNWRERKENNDWKENSAGWDNKKKGWIPGASKPRKPVQSKGWEHDDRFENEYN